MTPVRFPTRATELLGIKFPISAGGKPVGVNFGFSSQPRNNDGAGDAIRSAFEEGVRLFETADIRQLFLELGDDCTC